MSVTNNIVYFHDGPEVVCREALFLINKASKRMQSNARTGTRKLQSNSTRKAGNPNLYQISVVRNSSMASGAESRPYMDKVAELKKKFLDKHYGKFAGLRS